jgi:hypothetical protein
VEWLDGQDMTARRRAVKAWNARDARATVTLKAVGQHSDSPCADDPVEVAGRSLIPLSKAVSDYAALTKLGNAYGWYRTQATAGSIEFSGHRVVTMKLGNRWVVDGDEMRDALQSIARDLEERRARPELATQAYEAGHLGSQGTIETTWGSYRVRGDFHAVSVEPNRPYRGGAIWYCNSCMRPAQVEHGKPECHTCSDWGSCGRDCTASAVRCDACSRRMEI